MKTSITYAEYLQLQGLRAVAERHNEALTELVRAGRLLLDDSPGDRHGSGHVDDLMYGSRESVDEQLRKMHVTVEPRPPEPPPTVAEYHFDEPERAAAASVIGEARRAGWPEAEKLADLETTLKGFAPEAP